MPFIQVKVIENVFTPEQTQQIVRSLTDAMVAIEGENIGRSHGASSRRSRAARGASPETR